MARLTIADLLAHRVAVTPLEATALTLAVARELDRYRAACGPASLPDDAAIVLHRSGEVSFLAVPRASRTSEAVALRALLARLLGLDESAHAERFLQTGMTAYAFRAALARVADEDPAVLAAVFWRAASAIRRQRPRRLAAARAARAERRRQQPPAAELRRSIRRLEQQLFDARQDMARVVPCQQRRRQAAAAGWISLVCAVALLGMTLFAPDRHAAALAETSAAPAPLQPEPHFVTVAAVAPVPRGHETTTRTTRPATRRYGDVTAHPTKARTSPSRSGVPRPLFVGGTRAIGWTLPSR